MQLPAHNIVLDETAEVEVLGGALTAILLVLLGAAVWRGGAWAVVVAAPMVPFLLFDAYSYVFPTGLALVGI